MRIFRHHLFPAIVLLGAAEFAVFLVSPEIFSHVASGEGGWRIDLVDWTRMISYGVIMALAMAAMGLYHRRQRAAFAGIMVRVVVALGGGSAVVGLVSYLVPTLQIARSILVGSVVLSTVLVGICRFTFDRLVDDNIFRRRVLVLGAGRRARSISQLRRRTDLRGFMVVGFSEAQGDERVVPPERLVDTGASLAVYCADNEVDEIVVAMDDRRRSFPVHDLLECRVRGVEITELVYFLERETGKVRLDVLNPSWIIFSPGFGRNWWRSMSERSFDVLASLAILTLASPVILLTMLAIKLEEGLRAPVFYRQVRVGLEGRQFSVLKFRSMRVDAEAQGAQWAAKRDSRVTRVGAVIRKMRIDELPQIINVLKGDMGFVGPRPERPEFVAQFDERIPYYRERHYVKPGITGWAQLCYPYGASEQDAALKLEYDLYYVKNRSLLFDVMILLQTVEVVLWGKGGR